MALHTSVVQIDDYTMRFQIEKLDTYLGIDKYTYYKHFIGKNNKLKFSVDHFLDALYIGERLDENESIDVFIAAGYINDNEGIPDIVTTFRILKNFKFVEPHGIIARYEHKRPRYSSLLLHSFFSKWSAKIYDLKYFFVKPISNMLRIILEKLKNRDGSWIPIAVGFLGDVENIQSNYNSYFKNNPKRRSRWNTPEKFFNQLQQSYVMQQVEKRKPSGIFPSPIIVNWDDGTVKINEYSTTYKDFQSQISTNDLNVPPYMISYWGGSTNRYGGEPHITVHIENLVKYWNDKIREAGGAGATKLRF